MPVPTTIRSAGRAKNWFIVSCRRWTRGRCRGDIFAATGKKMDSAKVVPKPTITAVMWMNSENS